jgi:nicotinate-nucleotide--dimethylbenzimidazole phosphoribosyltransferase
MTASLFAGSATLQHVVSAISPASFPHAQNALIKLSSAQLPHVLKVGTAIAAAQHGSRLRYDHVRLLIVAADHGIADPGVDFAEYHPTYMSLAAIAGGHGAVCHLARNAGAHVLLVNAGMHVSLTHPAVISIGGSATVAFGPDVAALTRADVTLLLEAGIALMLSIKDADCDVLALGSIGLGAAESSAAIAGALYAMHDASIIPELPEEDSDLVSFMKIGRAFVLDDVTPSAYEIAEQFAGRETLILVGVILCAVSMNVPVIIDDASTVAAAALACCIAPAVSGSLIAAHRGRGVTSHLLRYMRIEPVFSSILGNGEGAATAMVLAFAQTAAALTKEL